MNKIELRIMGGLGNQLYQYSAALFLKKKYGVQEIIIDDGEYDTYKIRNLEINHLLHNKNVFFENIRSKKNAFYRESYHVYQKLYRMVTNSRPQQKLVGNKVEKYLCSYIDSDLSVDLNCDVLHMYGYFVSVDTALAVKEDLMQELWIDSNLESVQYQKILLLVEKKPCISVSIRCADDYVKNNWPVCSKEFYQKGLDYVLKKRGCDRPILIFADDIRKIKCEDWFSGYQNVIYVEELSVCECFELMRRCSDYVCSNSSFSWWGAFLSHSDAPIRVNPNKVFSGKSRDVDKLTFYSDLIYFDYITGEKVQ